MTGGPLVCAGCEMALCGATGPALEVERYKDGGAVARSVARARFLNPRYHRAVHERALMVSLPDGASALFARLPERGPGVVGKSNFPDEASSDLGSFPDIESALQAGARDYATWVVEMFGRRVLAP